MNQKEKSEYFDSNLSEIFSTSSSNLVDFICECLEDDRVKTTLKNWPNEIKIKVVEKHLLESEAFDQFLDENFSWSEFYEMYDGKFDERHMLHITIDKAYINELEDLGYLSQQKNDDWHKPSAGEYKEDENGNLVIIHSCPDRSLFDVDIRQYHDELGINSEWTIDTTLSIM